MTFNFDESIGSLPAELQADPQWAEARNRILASLRKDAEGLPMTTSQDLLMERMATTYALMRKREADPNVTMNVSDIRANNQQWLAMTSEFNKQITVGEDKRRSTMIENILQVINNVLTMMEDDSEREKARKRLAEGFKNAGL